MGPSTFRKLSAVCLVSTLVPSAMALSIAVNAAQALGLLPRAESCNFQGYQGCNQPLPVDWCCNVTTTCIAFNGGASAICCPAGENCSIILPIPCEVQNLNSTFNPVNPMHSNDLSAPLSVCGKACCPKGYSCREGQCALNAQSASSSTASVATTGATSTTSPTATTTPKSSSTSTSPPSSTSSPASSQAAAAASSTACNCSNYPAMAVLVGFFPGLIIGLILLWLFSWCGKKRQKAKHRLSGDFGPVAAAVSDPIYQETGPAPRTDFLRRSSKSKFSNTTHHAGGGSSPSRVRSFFSRSPTLTRTKTPSGDRDSSTQQLRTPESRMGTLRKEPSMESIKIYSPPNERLTRQTTFTDMMTNAGFRKDEPFTREFMASPGLVDPRRRDLGGGNLR